ncbi:hypothetical protein B5F76_09005 [Desulfovibrio sp. An276]|nr:hypothetical protein B5F76_09005 [Desulfovibrio sp. An276]
MAAYYNEIDPFAAAWLRELIKAGCIAPGEVDERSIADVQPADLAGFTQCHFFAGLGGWSLALRQAGWPDERPVWTGSCPCQPFSAAGKRRGFADSRHLWPEFRRLISQCRPHTVFGEQVASSDGLHWLDLVCDNLEADGYAVGAVVTCAASAGAPHIRQRLYWVADLASGRTGQDFHVERMADANGTDGEGCALHAGTPTGRQAETGSGIDRSVRTFWDAACWLATPGHDPRYGRPIARPFPSPLESGFLPVAHGIPGTVEQLRGYGNALCVPQAQAFIEAFIDYTLTGEGEAHDSKRVDLQDCQ